jgi:hypothetical protein
LVGDLERSSSSISQISKIAKYFQHGFALGVMLIGGFLLLVMGGIFFYPSYYIFISPSLIGAIFYAVTFGLTGGVNQKLAEHIWGIKCEQNIGTGLRDGFVLFIFFNIAFVPISMILFFPYWLPSPAPLQIFLFISFTVPFYILVLGVIGQQVAVLLHSDEEPARPSDFIERSHKCPYCGAKYYYESKPENQNIVTCQNCAKQFSIS